MTEITIRQPHVIADDRQLVPKPTLDFFDPPRELRHPRGKVRKPLRFELLVVHDDAAETAKGIAQRRNERRARVACVSGKKFVVFRFCTSLRLHIWTNASVC